MAKRSAACQPGATTRPLITVVVGLDSLKRTCELESGRVVTPGQIAPLLSEALIERVVFNAPSRIIDVSERRLFTGAVRRAVEVRDSFCQDPSVCDVPASQCQIDHIWAWIKGGKTEITNGQCLCAFHNGRKGTGPP